MEERRVDRIARLLRKLGGRTRLQELLEAVREEEHNADLSYQSVYVAIQVENQKLNELGERTRFVTSREGESWGWVRLRAKSDFATGTLASELDAKVHEANERVGDDIRSWLQRMDWRTFESTFLTRVLEALGFQDVQITQPTRDGGVDARVKYRRGIIEARAIVSAKRWTSRTVPVDEVRNLRGLQGDEDTAIVVTTGQFSQDSQNEALPSQNQRAVYRIDGENLVEICKRNQIGVKKVTLPELLTLDPEVDRDDSGSDLGDNVRRGATDVAREALSGHRFRDEMLGNPEKGLSMEEVARISGLAINTVRVYLSDQLKQKAVGDRIRGDEQSRARALKVVSQRRGWSE